MTGEQALSKWKVDPVPSTDFGRLLIFITLTISNRYERNLYVSQSKKRYEPDFFPLRQTHKLQKNQTCGKKM